MPQIPHIAATAPSSVAEEAPVRKVSGNANVPVRVAKAQAMPMGAPSCPTAETVRPARRPKANRGNDSRERLEHYGHVVHRSMALCRLAPTLIERPGILHQGVQGMPLDHGGSRGGAEPLP